MRFRITIVLSLLLTGCLFDHIPANTITQYGITWYLNPGYEIGQFVNGDYYVVDNGQGVRIIDITPGYSEGNHGSVVNPPTGNTQGYDSDVAGFDDSLTVTLPIVLHAGDSLVSTISLLPEDYTENDGTATPGFEGRVLSENHTAIKTAAVLTVLSEVPPPGTFRPAFVDAPKTLYSINDMNTAYINRVVDDNYDIDIAGMERILTRPWLTHLTDWSCREMHPVENMHNYHRDIGVFLSEVSVAVLINRNDIDKLRTLYIQAGLDYYAMATSGKGDSAFFKWPVIYAGLVLDKPEIYNLFISGNSLTPGRSEEKFYYWEDRVSETTSTIVPEGQTWTGAAVFFRKQDNNTEHEHLHPSEWDIDMDHLKNESYRHCCDSYPHVGMMLSAHICNAASYYNHPAAVDYIDRWMTEEFDTNYLPVIESEFGSGVINSTAQTSRSSFIDDIWSNYR